VFGLRPLHGFVPPHFFAPVKMLRIFPHRVQKNVSYSQNVMCQFAKNYLKIYRQNNIKNALLFVMEIK
jgi:hypothetical protein